MMMDQAVKTVWWERVQIKVFGKDPRTRTYHFSDKLEHDRFMQEVGSQQFVQIVGSGVEHCYGCADALTDFKYNMDGCLKAAGLVKDFVVCEREDLDPLDYRIRAEKKAAERRANPPARKPSIRVWRA
jgi:hypothetical protein